MKMNSGQQQGLLLLLFVCIYFLLGGVGVWWGAVHAFDLTCKFYLDKQLGFKSHAHTHVQIQTHTQPKEEKKSVTISIMNTVRKRIECRIQQRMKWTILLTFFE